MINLFIAKEITEDRLREAEKARLSKIVRRSQKFHPKQQLTTLACRIGLTQTC